MTSNLSIETLETIFDHPENRGHIYNNFSETIGNTPIVRVPRITEKYNIHADLMLKLEFFNPLSSVKDRLAIALITQGEINGNITPETIIIEPTSGNTGIGLAFICASKGYRLILTMPESMSLERRKLLRMFGAELILTPQDQGIQGAIDKANDLKEHYAPYSFIPQQFENSANPKIHVLTTAEEIWKDTAGQADVLISGVGTGGTLTGISQRLKELKPTFKTVAVEPEDSPVLSGGAPGPHKIQGIGAGFTPQILNCDLIDTIIKVSNDDAYKMAREASLIEGLPLGISSGAALHAAIQIGQQTDMKDKKIITIIPSSAERYLSTPLFKDLAGLDE